MDLSVGCQCRFINQGDSPNTSRPSEEVFAGSIDIVISFTLDNLFFIHFFFLFCLGFNVFINAAIIILPNTFTKHSLDVFDKSKYFYR